MFFCFRQVLEVSEIILHPDYNWDSSANDIALVTIINIVILLAIIITTIVIIITILIINLIRAVMMIVNVKVKLAIGVDLNTYSPACLPKQA